ncbi:DUF4844 domain-containing protein [uncultured Winogradskyella sp.]|uniref:DUF4844 domain-containing protein n=1 Tax=uncultured Winogradskyella sp. TaxID=395353 RepID=UPI0030DCFB31
MKLLRILLVLCLIQGCNEMEIKMLSNGSDVKVALRELQSQKKFIEDLDLFYPGAPDELSRVAAEKTINSVLLKLIESSSDNLTEKEFWLTLEVAAKQLGNMDSEEMDRGLSYMEEIMDIYKIESSDGRLNEWRYGFEPSSH